MTEDYLDDMDEESDMVNPLPSTIEDTNAGNLTTETDDIQ